MAKKEPPSEFSLALAQVSGSRYHATPAVAREKPEKTVGKRLAATNGSLDDEYVVMKWDDITESQLFGVLHAVKEKNDTEAAKNLVEYFYERLHNNEHLSVSVLLDYVEFAFGRILGGKSADVAFGLSQGRGEWNREETLERNLVATAYMVLLMRENPSKRKDGGLQEAKGKAAALFFKDGKGEKAMEEAYYKWSVGFWSLSDDALREIVKEALPNSTPF